MTTSGTTANEFSLFQIVEHAYAVAGVPDVQKLGYAAHKRAREVLAMIFGDWQNETNFPWKQDLVTLPLVQASASYVLGADTIDILDGVYVETATGTAVPMERIAEGDYINITNKTQQGRPDRFWLRRDIPAPTIFFWMTPDATPASFQFYRIKQLFDPTASAQTLDLAKRWVMATTKRLAYELMPYVTPREQRDDSYQNDRSVLRGEYREAFKKASSEDRETATTAIYPEGWSSPARYS